eukprot:1142050-Pelagomonas_calceolata.AAC.4
MLEAAQKPLSLTCCAQELYKAFAWPLYRIYGHAFEAFKTMVVDDGAAVISRLENEHGRPIPALTPEPAWSTSSPFARQPERNGIGFAHSAGSCQRRAPLQ